MYQWFTLFQNVCERHPLKCFIFIYKSDQYYEWLYSIYFTRNYNYDLQNLILSLLRSLVFYKCWLKCLCLFLVKAFSVYYCSCCSFLCPFVVYVGPLNFTLVHVVCMSKNLFLFSNLNLPQPNVMKHIDNAYITAKLSYNCFWLMVFYILSFGGLKPLLYEKQVIHILLLMLFFAQKINFTQGLQVIFLFIFTFFIVI